MAQGVEIVGILVSERDGVHSSRHKLLEGVFHLLLLSGVVERARQSGDNSGGLFGLRQEEGAGVGAKVASIEGSGHRLVAQSRKGEWGRRNHGLEPPMSIGFSHL
jgi:hypothetical protein